MSPWARVPPGDGVYCGGCDALLTPGTPVYQITMARGQRLKGPLVRCEACAGAAPPDLPAVPVQIAPVAAPARCDHKFIDSTHCLKCGWTPPPGAFTPVSQVARFDWRARAAGREPGEDDA